MRRSTLALCALVALSTLGCDKIQQIVNDIKKKRAGPTPAQTAVRDTSKHPVVAAHPAPGANAPQQSARANPSGEAVATEPQASSGRFEDRPYSSQDTGTVAPGMSEREIYSLWGPPAAVRRSGEYTYIHYPNGCERSCGTDDVVILRNGQVVDAIVRWAGHGYSGQSSSPASTRPHRPRAATDTTSHSR